MAKYSTSLMVMITKLRMVACRIGFLEILKSCLFLSTEKNMNAAVRETKKKPYIASSEVTIVLILASEK